MPATSGERICSRALQSRALQEEELERIIGSAVNLSIPHETEIKRIDCEYYVTVWPAGPAPPDSEAFLKIGEDGRILETKTEIYH
jgi:hypothetical protein